MGSRAEGQGQGSRIQVVDAALAGRALVPAWLSPSFLMGIGIGDPFGKRVPASAWLPPPRLPQPGGPLHACFLSPGLLQMQLILHYDETYREVKYGNMGLPDIDSKMLIGINVMPIGALLYTPVLIRCDAAVALRAGAVISTLKGSRGCWTVGLGLPWWSREVGIVRGLAYLDEREKR